MKVSALSGNAGSRSPLASGIALLAALTAQCVGPTGGEPAVTAPHFPRHVAAHSDTIAGLRAYYLADCGLPHRYGTAAIELHAPEGTDGLDVWVDASYWGRHAAPHGTCTVTRNVDALSTGSHTVRVSTPGSDTALYADSFLVSHPLFVLMSTDWDGSDNHDLSMANHDSLHQRHPELVITHFVGPYIFTDESMTEARRRHLVDWVLGLRETYGDEIGFHLHAWGHYLRACGLPPRDTPSFNGPHPDTSGYTIPLWSFDTTEFAAMVDTGLSLLARNGLGVPTAYRAGGWTADTATLQVLARRGFTVDASAVNWPRLDEVAGVPLYHMLAQAWPGVTDTSQPYTIELDGTGSSILEVPDNGVLTEYVSGSEMVAIFRANWPGGALERPRQLSIGCHANTLVLQAYVDNLEMILDTADAHLISRDRGPVMFARTGDMAGVQWSPDVTAAP